jgi:hypothetical protein
MVRILPGADLFFNGKSRWTQSMARGPWAAPVRGGLGHGRPKGLIELGLVAAPGHDGSPAVAQRKEGCTGSPCRASPGHGRLRGDRAMMLNRWRWWCSVQAVFGREEKRRRMRRGAVEDGRVSLYMGAEGEMAAGD